MSDMVCVLQVPPVSNVKAAPLGIPAETARLLQLAKQLSAQLAAALLAPPPPVLAGAALLGRAPAPAAQISAAVPTFPQASRPLAAVQQQPGAMHTHRAAPLPSPLHPATAGLPLLKLPASSGGGSASTGAAALAAQLAGSLGIRSPTPASAHAVQPTGPAALPSPPQAVAAAVASGCPLSAQAQAATHAAFTPQLLRAAAAPGTAAQAAAGAAWPHIPTPGGNVTGSGQRPGESLLLSSQGPDCTCTSFLDGRSTLTGRFCCKKQRVFPPASASCSPTQA